MITLRPATADDGPFLWRMLALAASMGDDLESVTLARTDPRLSGYVDDFGRPGDLGMIAVREGEPVGAAWVRFGAPEPSKRWTHEVPELAIATVPTLRGAGVGASLLEALIAAARGRYPAIVLSVREENPAVRLYERFGFVVEERVVNRVGTTSLAMRLAL